MANDPNKFWTIVLTWQAEAPHVEGVAIVKRKEARLEPHTFLDPKDAVEQLNELETSDYYKREGITAATVVLTEFKNGHWQASNGIDSLAKFAVDDALDAGPDDEGGEPWTPAWLPGWALDKITEGIDDMLSPRQRTARDGLTEGDRRWAEW